MKYAIAQTSGKQFLVKPGEWYDIDFIRDGEIGDYIYLNKILMFRNETEIQIGIRDGGYVEVLSGLSEGENIVAEGLKKVRPQGKIKPIKK